MMTLNGLKTELRYTCINKLTAVSFLTDKRSSFGWPYFFMRFCIFL